MRPSRGSGRAILDPAGEARAAAVEPRNLAPLNNRDPAREGHAVNRHSLFRETLDRRDAGEKSIHELSSEAQCL